jgi:hypothetical protein
MYLMQRGITFTEREPGYYQQPQEQIVSQYISPAPLSHHVLEVIGPPAGAQPRLSEKCNRLLAGSSGNQFLGDAAPTEIPLFVLLGSYLH